ncbi:MAG: tetratricopeptide repeat protein [bacterium]
MGMVFRYWSSFVLCALFWSSSAAQNTELLKQAEEGDALAQLSLGLIYLEGKEVPQDNVYALLWFRRSAEQGLRDAQFFCGQMYVLGNGVAVDYAEAFRWYELAANQGLARAHHALGLMYENGLGVPENNIESYARYFFAAVSGFKQAEREKENLRRLMTEEELASAMVRSNAIWEEFMLIKQIQHH